MGTYMMVYCDGDSCNKEARMLEPVGIGRRIMPADWHEDFNTGMDIRFGGRNNFHYCPACWVKIEAEKEAKRKENIEKMKNFKENPGDLFRQLSNRKNNCEEHF